jgi:hypothetical protein
MVEQGAQELLAEATREQFEEQSCEPCPGGRADGVLRGGDAALVMVVHETSSSGRDRERGLDQHCGSADRVFAGT